MSKLFGRKDRTKILADHLRVKRENAGLRESNNESLKTINSLKQRLQHASAVIGQYQSQIARHEQYEAAFIKMVGGYAIGAGEPVSLALRDVYDDRIVMNSYRPPMDLSAMSRNSIGTMKIRHEVMCLLKVESVQERMSRIMHFRASLSGERIHYSISESALHEMPIEILASRIAEEMAIALVGAIRNPKPY